MKVPRCAACTRHDEDCNITECVAYPYPVVRMLQAEIDDLKARLATTSSNNNHASTAVDQSASVVGKEAEEVGILSIGGPNRHTEDKYGKSYGVVYRS